MPIYDFKCNDCGCVAERLVFNNEEVGVVCVDCHSSNVSKLPPLSNFELKGTCWEKDNYTRSRTVEDLAPK